MLDFIKNKSDCTGCGACYSICPKHCITMIIDAEGFLYPSASDDCINCRLCYKVCPIIKDSFSYTAKHSFEQVALGYRNPDLKIWKKSSSGGAFSAIVNKYSDNNTKVFGAVWDDFNVKHTSSLPDQIDLFRKSKYIESNIGNSFIEARNYLEEGKKVIFSGTPCQIAGLQSYLKKEYANLLTIDLICHGKGSPSVFKECLKNTEMLLNNVVLSYEFRAKRKAFETEYMSKVVTDTGFYYLRSERFTQLFLNLLCVRPSCGSNCIFHSKKRFSDITIADLKGIDKINTKLIGSKYNYSTVIANSEKGLKILSALAKESYSFYYNIEDVFKYNPNFVRKTSESVECRNNFFKDFFKSPQNAVIKYTTQTVISKQNIWWRIYDLMPNLFRRLVVLSYRLIKITK